MYELVQLCPNNYYVSSPTRVGIYMSAPGEVWLIDAGSHKDTGRKVYQHIQANGWRLAGILATHSHADHIGGAALLTQRTGAPIYARALERCFVEHTILEPGLLWGSHPPRALQGKAFLAAAVPCLDVAEAPLPEGMEIIPLPGHSPELFGVRTPEGVFFCGDALFSQEVVRKYHVNYLWNVAQTLESLDKLSGIRADWFVPAHAEPCASPEALREVNKGKILELLELICRLCAQPMDFESLLAALFDHYGLTMDLSQHTLVGATLRAYVAHLLDAGRLEATFSGNKLLWKAL